MDWLDLLAVQGTLKSLLQHHSSKTSILLFSAFFIVQLSHPYMTTGKSKALTRWNFVGKVTPLLFRSMNQGKLEVVKQEMQRANINILGISELKWTGMGEFNSDEHLLLWARRNGAALIVNKRVQNAVLRCNLKNDRMISLHFQGKPFNITVIQVYAPTSNAEEAKLNHSMKTYCRESAHEIPPMTRS